MCRHIFPRSALDLEYLVVLVLVRRSTQGKWGQAHSNDSDVVVCPKALSDKNSS